MGTLHDHVRGIIRFGNDPRTLMRHEGITVAQIVGAVGLMVAAAWVAWELPLFGGAGIGQGIALCSCISGMLLALSVLVGWIRRRRAHDERFGLSGIVAGIIMAVVALSACLDALAVLEYFIHG